MLCHRPAAIRGGLVLLIALHFAWLFRNFEPAIFSPDDHGYLLQAYLLATRGQTWFVPESELQHLGIHWFPTASGRYYSQYPFGMPLLAALLYLLGGLTPALMVNLVLASLTLLGFYLLCRTCLGEGWALIGTAAMAVNPVFNAHALTKDAHEAAACFLVWGLYLLGRWSLSRSPVLAFVLGLVWGFLPPIRYPEALLMLAVPLFFFFEHRPDRRTWGSYLTASIGAALPLGALLWHNQIAFGAFWKTGYSLTHEQTAFGWSSFIQHALPYLRNLHGEGAGLFFALGLAGTAVLCSQRHTRQLGLLLVAVLVPVTLLYMAYYWGGGPGPVDATLRFLLPTFFLYTLAGLFLLKALAAQWSRIGRVVVAVLLFFHAVWGLNPSLQSLRNAQQEGAPLALISRWVEEKVEPGSLLIAEAKIQEQLELTGRWRLVDNAVIGEGPTGPLPAVRDRRGPAPLGPPAAQSRRLERYRSLPSGQRLAQAAADLAAWAGKSHRIYWLASEEEFERRQHLLQAIASLAVVDTLALPQKSLPEERFRPPGNLPRGLPPRFGLQRGNLLLVAWTPR